MALAFAREGADVCFSYLPYESDDADRTSRVVEDAGQIAVAVEVDIRTCSSCEMLVERCLDELGGIDIVVNNAAYQMAIDSFADLTTRQLERTFDTNIFAPIWIIQGALPHLGRGSAIINTTSIQATNPSPKMVDYAATKAALVNLTQCLATELAERGIRGNSVAPGPIWTPLIPATMPAEKVVGFGKDTPLGRAGHSARPGRTARRGGAGVRVLGVGCEHLCDRRSDRRDRRTNLHVAPPSPASAASATA